MAILIRQAMPLAISMFLLIGCISIETFATAAVPPPNWYQPQAVAQPNFVSYQKAVAVPVEDIVKEDTLKEDDEVTIIPRRQLFLHGVTSSFLRSAGEEFQMQCINRKDKVECFAADSNPLSVKIVN